MSHRSRLRRSPFSREAEYYAIMNLAFLLLDCPFTVKRVFTGPALHYYTIYYLALVRDVPIYYLLICLLESN